VEPVCMVLLWLGLIHSDVDPDFHIGLRVDKNYSLYTMCLCNMARKVSGICVWYETAVQLSRWRLEGPCQSVIWGQLGSKPSSLGVESGKMHPTLREQRQANWR
jgi:hypothetical protein